MEEGMKKSVFNLVIIALMVTACGSATNNPAPTATEAVVIPAATSEAADAPVQNPDGKVQVQVTMGDNWIQSDLTTFKVGVTYVFTVTNTGRRAHIFSVSQPTEDKSTNGMNAAKAGALLFVPQDELFPGAVVTVEYTFTGPAPAGTLEFACLIPMHYKMGQVLPIVVE
jgi:uncharacterized cupredoxin-like copper-binding protein